MSSNNIRDEQVLSVIAKYEAREQKGFNKYNTNTDRTDLSLDEWLNHLQEELMDGTIYIERIRKELRERKLLGLTPKDV